MSRRNSTPLTEAQSRLAADNLGLAYAAARRIAADWHLRHREEEFLSACQEGLVLAARRYDPSRGFTFASYAWRAMLSTCREERDAMRWVRVPRRSGEGDPAPRGRRTAKARQDRAAAREKALAVCGAGPHALAELTSDADPPWLDVAREDEAADARARIASLPPDQALVVEAVVMDGASQASVARRYGVPRAAVHFRLARGMDRLRQAAGSG